MNRLGRCFVFLGLLTAAGLAVGAQGAPSQWNGVYSDGQAKRGEAAY